MSTTLDLITTLKAELKSAGLTYADLARELGMAESSIKRMFAKGDMPLTRVDEICRVLKTDFAELARQVAANKPQSRELTLEQEKAVVADRRLLLLAICCVSQWTFEQMIATYDFTEAECVKYLVQLDKLGFIELRPMNRYRLKVAKGFRWRPNGPVMQYFRAEVVQDYYAGGFDAAGARLHRQEPGRGLRRAPAAHRAGLRAAAPGRPAAAGVATHALHAGGGNAVLAVRGVQGPEAARSIKKRSPASGASEPLTRRSKVRTCRTRSRRTCGRAGRSSGRRSRSSGPCSDHRSPATAAGPR
jgi:transcriptional regulator with XRE-family HTH domain